MDVPALRGNFLYICLSGIGSVGGVISTLDLTFVVSNNISSIISRLSEARFDFNGTTAPVLVSPLRGPEGPGAPWLDALVVCPRAAGTIDIFAVCAGADESVETDKVLLVMLLSDEGTANGS